ncbi:putative transport protein [Cavenderia fasciculata]|uniref:Transport protein n=1 Tax=Cavenderia fasciculata TaxID=261658 RepID=F4PIC1_CACFS|nr:putative transport protein [Cavenderia fasciculata]EGG24555.1 putative transport protein [Cavenderia fasciculata]|eukprot:XP_004362406.1 putative transport protein [Cavenderia fasciculata]
MSRRAYPTDPTNVLAGQAGGPQGGQQQQPMPVAPQPFNGIGGQPVVGGGQPQPMPPQQPFYPPTNNYQQPPLPVAGGVGVPYQPQPPMVGGPVVGVAQPPFQPSPPQQQPPTTNQTISPSSASASSASKRAYPVDPSNANSLVSGMQNLNVQGQQQQQPYGQPQPQPVVGNVIPPQVNLSNHQAGLPATNTNINGYPTAPYNTSPVAQPPYQQGGQPQQGGYQPQPPQQQYNPAPVPAPYNQYQGQQPQQQYNQVQPQQGGYQQQQPQQQQQGGYQPQQPYNQQQGQQQHAHQQALNYQQQQQMPQQDVVPTAENLCPKSFMRMSMNAVPNLPATLGKVHIPLGCSIQPLALDPNFEVPLISTQIVRCKRVSCKAYINPFVVWVDGGGRWKCNVCDLVNDITQDYFSPIDLTTGKRADIAQRPELQRGCVEFLASREYTIRAPQPPSYFFVIDVCYESVVSGMLNCAIESIKASLDNMPGDSRTRVGFMTFDDSLHFYNLRLNTGKPQVYVVTEMDNIYVPPFDDFLVNLKEARPIVDKLLDIIKTTHMQKKEQKVISSLGNALKAAFQICQGVGGKIVVLQSYLPRGHFGKLQVREYQQQLGTKKEALLLQPSDLGEFYKEFGLNCVSHQLSVDVFLFGTDYVDTSSLGCMAQITGGELFYYPSFIASRDGQTFAANLMHTLTRVTGWEAVMRVRTSRQLNINVYHGNYFLKSSDLLSLATTDQDKTYTLQMSINDAITTKYVTIQAALLYSHSSGERRVRVLTTSVPVVTNYADLFRYADVSVVASLITKMAIDKALSSTLNDAREAIANKCVDILTAYKTMLNSNQAGGGNQSALSTSVTLSPAVPKLLLPESLKHLPLYVVAMVKNIRMKTVDLVSCLNFFYPQFYNLLAPATEPTAQSVPTTLKLSSDQLSRAGVFAVINGYSIFIYVGEQLDQRICHEIFGCDFASLDPLTFQDLPLLDNDANRYARKIIEMSKQSYSEYMRMVLIKSNDRQKGPEFQSLLVEDRSQEGGSYYEFITQLQTRVQQKN